MQSLAELIIVGFVLFESFHGGSHIYKKHIGISETNGVSRDAYHYLDQQVAPYTTLPTQIQDSQFRSASQEILVSMQQVSLDRHERFPGTIMRRRKE